MGVQGKGGMRGLRWGGGEGEKADEPAAVKKAQRPEGFESSHGPIEPAEGGAARAGVGVGEEAVAALLLDGRGS